MDARPRSATRVHLTAGLGGGLRGRANELAAMAAESVSSTNTLLPPRAPATGRHQRSLADRGTARARYRGSIRSVRRTIHTWRDGCRLPVDLRHGLCAGLRVRVLPVQLRHRLLPAELRHTAVLRVGLPQVTDLVRHRPTRMPQIDWRCLTSTGRRQRHDQGAGHDGGRAKPREVTDWNIPARSGREKQMSVAQR
jgi:hypothetical protein